LTGCKKYDNDVNNVRLLSTASVCHAGWLYLEQLLSLHDIVTARAYRKAVVDL